MDFQEFKKSLSQSQPPKNLSPSLKALWQDAKGNWDKAHDCVDSLSDPAASHIHAYLHRKEGDHWNADYWYKKAGEVRPQISLEEEWENLTRKYIQLI